ncbi:hypothetical protein [Synechococcus sp. PROS-7-1]|uniref:DUF7005 family protein n=1 Tax=Synechococcus sp. PROS-7-1 TaxID=1442556 RepID=UPI0021061BBF|nr:hypothetical protein [Synechococcus sp. PROS-7-1]
MADHIDLLLATEEKCNCPMQTLEEYCRPFKGAETPWPPLPLPADEREIWWRRWLETTPTSEVWNRLRLELPQLLLQPGTGVREGEAYRRLVLQGAEPLAEDLNQAPVLKDPDGLTLEIAEHPTGAVPVLTLKDHDDFVLIVRCLAYRCEDKPVLTTVHAQAISGLIHWGLIRDLSAKTRCQILLLHRAPYASIPAERSPGRPDQERWLNQSQQWRREHELAHIACTRLVGEMRINLYDELIADALGMLASLGTFDAELFRLALGLSADGTPHDQARAHVYVSQLQPNDRGAACQMVLERARELETMLQAQQWPDEAMPLLQRLCRSRLDQALMADASEAAGATPSP